MNTRILTLVLLLLGATRAFAQPSIPVTNLNPVTTASIVGRNTAGTGRGEVLTPTNVRSILGLTTAGAAPTANVVSFLTAADYSAMRTQLGLVIGTNVQAYDADLTSWAAITPGANVGTALAIAIGSAGAFVTFNGALGTPSSGTLTNATGMPKADVMEAPLFAEDAGASDTYAATLSPAITGYVTGNHYRFKANTANTGAASINFNALGAKTIVKVAGGITTALADNDIRAGQWVDLVYDGTNMQMQSVLGNGGMTNPMTTAGDTIYGGTSGTPTRLAAGTAYQIARMNSAATAVEWAEARPWRSLGIHLFDDFLMDFVPGSPWTVSNSGTGADTSAGAPAIINRPGAIQFKTGTTTTGYGSLYSGRNSMALGGGPVTLEFSARTVTALSDATEEYDFYLGLGDTRGDSNQVDGLVFVYNRNVSANWYLISSKASTRTSVDTGIPVVNGTWFKLRLEINAACTSAQAYIDDVLVGSAITTNLPDTTSNLLGIMASTVKSAGTTDRRAEIDYVYMTQIFTTAR